MDGVVVEKLPYCRLVSTYMFVWICFKGMGHSFGNSFCSIFRFLLDCQSPHQVQFAKGHSVMENEVKFLLNSHLKKYFLTDRVLEEILFGWPRQNSDLASRELLALRLQAVIYAVGLSGIVLDEDPLSLSGGYKRRLALAVQLIRMPDLLLLDEPLAGLDWRARADVVKLLKNLKKELTLLVVSHDLKELAPVVDKSWKMEMGGILKEAPLSN